MWNVSEYRDNKKGTPLIERLNLDPLLSEDEEIIDINLISMTLQEGPRKGELVEFDVAFQTGNTVSFTVPADDEDLLEALKPGKRLMQMQCYSILAVFNGSGVVSGKTRITSGPKRGEYTLDVTIDGA